MRTLLFFSALFLLAPACKVFAVAGPEVRDGEVAAQLVSPYEAVEPGQTVPVGIRFRIDEGWHIYWENSGDTGQPPTVNWDLPGGATAASFAWPYPEIYRNAHLVDYTYSGEVTLYSEIVIPESWQPGRPFPIAAAADWLMCAEICIPGSAELTLELPVATASVADEEEMAAFENTKTRWPGRLAGVTAELRSTDTRLQLRIDGLSDDPGDPASLYFFAVDPVVAPAGGQTWQVTDGTLVGNLERSPYAENLPDTVQGVLFRPDGWPALDGRKALSVEAARSTEPPATIAGGQASPGDTGLLGVLAIAFAGGIILNLMPCVFPVLGLKIMGFVKQAGNDRRKIVSHGLLFTAGVVVSFWILAGILLAFRAGGAELGWGFQLQSPGFVFGMIAFLFLFGLNLAGLFEIGFGLAAAGSKAEKGGGPLGSFLSGVLATVVATPCSAPFLAAALAAALTLPPFLSFLTFTAIALGLAAPYLTLSSFPALLQKLPKPGAWMESLKQFMAFPLFATAGWLVYVLAAQVDGENLLNALFAISGIALASWIYGRFAAPHRPRKSRRIAVGLALLIGIGSVAYGIPRKSAFEWIEWSPETIRELREDDRIIYVDFTARWCATCQVNKRVVFGSKEVKAFIEDEDVALVRADWTNEDPAITRRLMELGKAAVPVNLVYLPDEPDPTILPETLTPGMVLRAFRGE